MFRVNRKWAAAFALLPILLGAGAFAASVAWDAPAPHPPIGAEQWQPRAGDVIITGADDMIGRQIASASGGRAVFSHIGLVVEHRGRLAVIESSPFGAGHVAYADLGAFTSDGKLTDLMILRPRGPFDTARLNREAERLAAARVPFDLSLDMADNSRLYCAELVYKLLAGSGVDLGDLAWTDAYVPMAGDRRLVAPDAFAHSTRLEPIFRRSAG